MTNNTLKCRYCNEIKILSSNNFKIEKRTKLGFDSVCRVCRRTERNNHRKLNRSVFLKKEAENRKNQKYKEYHKKYWDENKEKLNDNAKERYKKNPTPYLTRSKQQKESNPKKYKQYQKEYRKKNRIRLNEYNLNRYHSDIRRKLRGIIGGGIRKRLKGETKESNSINYIGCTWDFLIGYLESKFSNEMNWDNIGTKWHLDHIIPCRAFDFNDDEQIRKCFHYTNLQPLLATDNCSKQDRMPDGTLARNLLTRTQL